MSRPCPVGCDRKARVGHLMCYPCWKQVPLNLQNAVYASWKRWQRNRDDGDLLHTYHEARTAAIKYVLKLREESI